MKPIRVASLFGVGLSFTLTVLLCLVSGCESPIEIFPLGYPTIDNFPDWSPDGRKLAFVKPSDDRNDNGTIWVVRLDGSGLRRVTHGV